MNDRYFLAVDLGATSGRTVIGHWDGTRVDMQEWTRFANPMIPLCGHLFWDLPALYHEVLLALRRASQAGIPLASVGIDTWGCDFACFAADGQLAGLPYCYRDAHTEGAVDRFCAAMPRKELYARTGIQFMDFNSLFQLDTLRRSGCAALEAADKVLFIPDALAYLLTGEAVTEYTVASTSQLLDARTGQPDAELLSAVGLAAGQLGRMARPGDIVGRLTPQVERFTGFADLPVVAVAGHDTASAVAAVPATDANFAYLSCGTWSLLGVESPAPILTEESLRLNFTNEGGLDGTIRFLKNICGLWLLERCRERWPGAPQDVKALTALSETSACDALIFPDAPCFAHPDDMTEAIAAYCRQTGQTAPQTPGDYCRTIFRSLALRYRQVAEMLQALTPVRIERLHAIGGGSLNRHLMQNAADALGLPVVAGPTEGTALGNLLVQVRAAGGVESLSGMRRLAAASVETVTYTPRPSADWDAAYARFLALPEQLKP